MTENNEFDSILNEVKKERELDRRHTDLLMKEHNIDPSKRFELELMSDEEREVKVKEYANSNDTVKKKELDEGMQRLRQIASEYTVNYKKRWKEKQLNK